MKFRQISFKSFQKSKNKKKKTKEATPEQTAFDVVETNTNINFLVTDSCNNFEPAPIQDVSLRCSLRRYKTSVTPRNKYVLPTRRSAFSDDEEEEVNNVLQYELEDIDKVLNSGRKERTRIKTNPWIPQRKSVHEEVLLDFVPEGANPEDYLNVCILSEEAGKSYNSTEENDKVKLAKRQLGLNDLNANRWSIISEGDISIDLNSPTIEELNERFADIDYEVDFKYEENIDNVLDDECAARLAKRLSINDLLDDYCEESSDASNSSMEISDSTSCSGSVSSEGSTETQLPLGFTKHFNRSNRMEDSIDAGYSSLSRDSRYPSTSDSDNADQSDDNDAEENMTLVHGNIANQNCVNCDSNRTLPDIRNSLQDKVNQLRAEKMIVEEKIREAQEEDLVRQKETQRLRRHLPVYKKQVLLKTLNSLKERLETQSQRLQKSYSTVMSMQRRFAQRHNPFFMVPNSNFQ